MRHTRKKLAKIVEELLTYFDSLDATDINFQITHTKEAHRLHVKGNFSPEYAPNLPMLERLLKKGRRPDLEETYWTLTGISDMEDEMQLVLIGAMIDEAEIKLEENNLTFNLVRYRNSN